MLAKADNAARQDLIHFFNKTVFPNKSTVTVKKKPEQDEEEEDLTDAIAVFNLGPGDDNSTKDDSRCEDATDEDNVLHAQASNSLLILDHVHVDSSSILHPNAPIFESVVTHEEYSTKMQDEAISPKINEPPNHRHVNHCRNLLPLSSEDVVFAARKVGMYLAWKQGIFGYIGVS